MDTIKLIVGLGNPEKIYDKSRHNIGKFYILCFCKKYEILLSKNNKFYGYTAIFKTNKKKLIYLLIPTTYMNLSGKSIISLCQYYKISYNEILVVHDELHFLPGIAKFKKDGGHAGHNGIKNIIKTLKTDIFYRLRIGIGYPKKNEKIKNFVLMEPEIKEKKLINKIVEKSISSVKIWVEDENYFKAIQYLHT